VQLQLQQGGSLAELLVREGMLDEDDLFFLMSRHLGVPAIPEERLHHLTLSPEIRRRVPRALARSGVLVPLDLDVNQGALSVALFDPSDPEVLDRLRQQARVAQIRPYLARRTAITAAVKAAYSDDDEEGGPPEQLPFLGPPEELAPADEPPPKDVPVEPGPKVEIDPSLAEEIAALSGTGTKLGRSAKMLRPAPPSRPRAARVERDTHLESDAHLEIQPTPPPRPPAEKFPEAVTEVHELRARSLLRRSQDEEVTNPFGLFVRSAESTDDLDVDPLGVDDHTPVAEMPELESVTPGTRARLDAVPTEATPLPDVPHMEVLDALLKELLSSVGILVAMLQERIDPAGGSYREFGRIARLVARELGMDEITVSRVALAAHLYGLDIALRREVGVTSPLEVTAAFGTQPSAPGGLGPSLRMLGAKALGLVEGEADPPGATLIRLVADYLALRAESEDAVYDLETVAQLLRAGGSEPLMIEALLRAVESSDTARVRIEPE
jgi:hypothetical protein